MTRWTDEQVGYVLLLLAFFVVGCLVMWLEHRMKRRRNRILPPPHHIAVRGCARRPEQVSQQKRDN
jgi:hypothetical protein